MTHGFARWQGLTKHLLENHNSGQNSDPTDGEIAVQYSIDNLRGSEASRVLVHTTGDGVLLRRRR